MRYFLTLLIISLLVFSCGRSRYSEISLPEYYYTAERADIDAGLSRSGDLSSWIHGLCRQYQEARDEVHALLSSPDAKPGGVLCR